MATGNALAAASGGIVAASVASSGDYNNSGPTLSSISNGSTSMAAAASGSSIHQGNQGYHQLSVTSKLIVFVIFYSNEIDFVCLYMCINYLKFSKLKTFDIIPTTYS